MTCSGAMRRTVMTMPARAWLKPFSVAGVGVRLLDYRPVNADVFEATCWITLFFIPIVPIATWLIRPGTAEAHRFGTFYRYQVVGTRPLRLAAVLRKYGMTVLAIFPMAVVFAQSPTGRPPTAPQTIGVVVAMTWFFIVLLLAERSGTATSPNSAVHTLGSGRASPARQSA